MKRLLNGKLKLIEILLLLLACYPLIKLNYTTILFVAFCTLSVILAFRAKEVCFTKTNFINFLSVSGYFFVLALSIFYSENSAKGINRIVQQLPLLMAPLVVVFCRPNISEKLKIRALNLFLISNIVYVIILLGFYIYYRDQVDLNTGQTGLFVSFDRVQFVLRDIIDSYVLFIHKAYFSMGFVLSAVFALSRANHFFHKNNTRSLLYFIIFLCFSSLVVYAFSFPNVIALLFSVFSFIVFEIKKENLKMKKVFISSFFLMTLFISGMLYFSSDADIKRGVGFLKSVVYHQDIEGNDPRIEIYKTYDILLETAQSKDLLFGFGVGDEQLLIHRTLEKRLAENKNKNLLSFNEEFNRESWFTNNISVVTNAVLSPEKTKTAEALVEENSFESGSHNISTELDLVEDVEYTFSVYARPGTADRLVMRLGEIENRAYFNLADGSISKFKGIVNAGLEEISNSWVRCWITVKGDSKALLIIGMLDATLTYNYKGSKKELYVWGAQVERANKMSSYVKNTSELMQYAYNENLNTHNTYLFFLMSTGILGLVTFLLSLAVLFRKGLKNKDALQWTFCSIIALNFLTENILSRQSGLMFVAIMAIILFSEFKSKKDVKKSL